jgi:hypothetical protein
MMARPILCAAIISIAAALVVPPVALADTCCANTTVRLDPQSARAGDAVRLTGMECLNADNTGPKPLNLGSFWLWTGDRGAEAVPNEVPGPGLPGDLPPTEEWLPFDSVDAAARSAVITVPALPDGTYQLWWWCDDGSGPGGGIHYSTGPRLAVGVPDTATEALDPPETPSVQGLPAWPVPVFGLSAMIAAMWASRGHAARPERLRTGSR